MENTIENATSALDRMMSEISLLEYAETAKYMKIAASIWDAALRNEIDKAGLAILFKVDSLELDRWLSGTHRFSPPELVFISQRLEVDIRDFLQ